MAAELRMGFVFLCCVFGIASAKEFVPVLIKSSVCEQEIGTFPALKQLSTQDFADHFNQRLESKPLILIFEEENLSSEDFIENQNQYAKLKNLGKCSEFLPSVQNPLRALKKIVPVEKSTLEDVLDQGLDVVLVKMDDAGSYEDRPQMLRRHDAKMSEIFLRAQKKRSDVILVYTARYTSWTEPEEVHRVRRLLQDTTLAENSTELAIVAENILLYASEVPKLWIYNESIALMNLLSSTQDTRTNNQSLALKFSTHAKEYLSLIFHFYNETSSAGYWSLENVTYSTTNSQSQTFVPQQKIVVPVGFSYHCTSETVMSSESGNLTFSNFQVQAFMTDGSTAFSDAYNCELFFTAPIWSGLFVMTILAAIMMWGLVMIMDIRTMDQFDDPKGKTITISAVE